LSFVDAIFCRSAASSLFLLDVWAECHRLNKVEGGDSTENRGLQGMGKADRCVAG
jgi:hypothetical protein